MRTMVATPCWALSKMRYYSPTSRHRGIAYRDDSRRTLFGIVTFNIAQRIFIPNGRSPRCVDPPPSDCQFILGICTLVPLHRWIESKARYSLNSLSKHFPQSPFDLRRSDYSVQFSPIFAIVAHSEFRDLVPGWRLGGNLVWVECGRRRPCYWCQCLLY
ncbi:hypothetical protein CC79DRAFT_564821 [Sarocladium strictum]